VPPLIVTALMDAVAQERFDQLRRSHFPPERNHLDAHLTLFHRLPDDPAISAALQAAVDRPVITARVRRVRGRLHVTVQNKADPAAAARLLAELGAVFSPYDVQVVGLGLCRYLGGPWEAVRRFGFHQEETTP
jgi:hypothetical protein